jgi:hypothetical protein
MLVDLSSSLFSFEMKTKNRPNRSGTSEPDDLSKRIVGIPATVNRTPKNFRKLDANKFFISLSLGTKSKVNCLKSQIYFTFLMMESGKSSG